MAEIRDRETEVAIELALVFERCERCAQTRNDSRWTFAIGPRGRREKVQNRRAIPHAPQHDRKAHVEGAEIDEHEQPGWPGAQQQRMPQHRQQERRDFREGFDRPHTRPAARIGSREQKTC